MAEREASGAGGEHAVLVLLFGPRKNPPRERRLFSPVTLVSLVSPGSVPFAVAATAIEVTFAWARRRQRRHHLSFRHPTSHGAAPLSHGAC